jgi:hypothetical protein
MNAIYEVQTFFFCSVDMKMFKGSQIFGSETHEIHLGRSSSYGNILENENK